MTKKKGFYLLCLMFLAVSYVLCRFTFFPLHGMHAFPNYLFLFGLVVLILAILLKSPGRMIAASVGYLLSFGLAFLFHTEGTDPGGGKTDNLWIFWSVCYLFILLAGLLADIILKKINKRSL